MLRPHTRKWKKIRNVNERDVRLMKQVSRDALEARMDFKIHYD